METHRRYAGFVLAGVLALIAVTASGGAEFEPGKARWAIKTSVAEGVPTSASETGGIFHFCEAFFLGQL